MSDETTPWTSALEQIPERAREGKTASILIAGAEEEIAQREEGRTTLLEAIDANLNNAKKICDDKDKQIIDVMHKWDECEKKLKDALNPRPRQSADDKTVNYSMHAPYSYSKWRLDQIESVLMWLRLQGAADSSVIELRDGLNIDLPFSSFDNTVVPPDLNVAGREDETDPKSKRWYDRWWVPTVAGLFMVATSVVGSVRLVEMVVGS